MEIYDIAMIVILVGTTIYGALRGFVWQLASIASIVLSYLVAVRLREPLSQSIEMQAPWNGLLAMLILFIVTSLLVWVAFRLATRTIDRFRLKEFDRHLGAVFGLIKGGLFCVLATAFAVTLAGDQVRNHVVDSHGGRLIARLLDASETFVPTEIHEVVHPYLERFDAQFAVNEHAENGSLETLSIDTAMGVPADAEPWQPPTIATGQQDLLR